MYECGMKLQLTPRPSSKSQTPVTLLSERQWGRLNPTLLTDSISLAYMCPCLWSTTQHYQSCSPVVFNESMPSGFDPRNNWIRFCDSKLHSTGTVKQTIVPLIPCFLWSWKFHYVFTSPTLNPVSGQLKPIHTLSCINISHFLRAIYYAHLSFKICPNSLLSAVFAEIPFLLLFLNSEILNY